MGIVIHSHFNTRFALVGGGATKVPMIDLYAPGIAPLNPLEQFKRFRFNRQKSDAATHVARKIHRSIPDSATLQTS